ncbi:MAG: Ribonuclease P protein component [Planctomycetes bacterium ADurb.Bin401]|nr:MAG: Ribonuclease P protein component [Planctomycetes bacterium ADurb.Bin401]
MPVYKFSKSSRISSKQGFKAVFDYKLFTRNNLITVYLAPNNLEKPRFAVSVSSRIGPAVLRNRLKRIAREAFRLSQHDIPAGFDYLIIYSQWLSKRPESDIKNISLSEVRQGFTDLVDKLYKRYETRKKQN